MRHLTIQMAWRNVWRNPRRSVLTLSAVAFATLILIFMLSWQFGSYDTMINSAVSIYTGHLQVQARGYHDKQRMGQVVRDPAAVARMLEDIPGVAAYTTRARAFSLVSSEDRTCSAMVVGIDPEREKQVSTLKSIVRQGSFLSSEDGHQCLMGGLMARGLKVDTGDEIVLLGQGRDGSIAASAVRVKGLFESGRDELDRGVVQLPLAIFQDIYSMQGAVHEVVVLCSDLGGVAEVKSALLSEPGFTEAGLDALDWKELMPGLVQSIQMDLASGFIFYAILILVVVFSILNTFLMAVFERKKEFGVLLALGSSPGRVSRMILSECGLITGLGTAVGILLGAAVTIYFQARGIAFSGTEELLRQFGLPERMYPKLSLLSVAVGSAVVLLITSFAVIYPALKVLRLRPVEAISTTR
jgi:putative ABC transport system permease protein